MTGTLVIIACVFCFALGIAVAAQDAAKRIRLLEVWNDQADARARDDREYWIHQRDEAREHYEQAAAIARGAFVAVGGTPAGTGDE